jgi:penicillin-binding protein 1A
MPLARMSGRRALLAAAGAVTLLAVVVAAWAIRYAVAINRLGRGIGDTVFLGADGKPWFRLDEHRREVALADMAPALRHAVVAVEDHRFYRHLGIDAIAVARAVVHNVQERSLVEGGSTLTQQLARTIFLSNARTAGRKAKEAALAFMMERRLSKDQILELYLNRVYMGSGRYGAESMSQAVFGKPASSLSLAEAAYLAGLIRAPAALSPWSNPQGALERSHVVLRRMREEHYITPDEEDAARRARLRIVLCAPPSRRREGRVCEGVSPRRVPGALRQRPSARLDGPHHFLACAPGAGGECGRRRASYAADSRSPGRARGHRPSHRRSPRPRRRPRCSRLALQPRRP